MHSANYDHRVYCDLVLTAALVIKLVADCGFRGELKLTVVVVHRISGRSSSTT